MKRFAPETASGWPRSDPPLEPDREGGGHAGSQREFHDAFNIVDGIEHRHGLDRERNLEFADSGVRVVVHDNPSRRVRSRTWVLSGAINSVMNSESVSRCHRCGKTPGRRSDKVNISSGDTVKTRTPVGANCHGSARRSTSMAPQS